MERDYGYVKVRMGPLFPSKGTRPDDYYPASNRTPQYHQYNSAFTPLKDHDRYISSPPYNNYLSPTSHQLHSSSPVHKPSRPKSTYIPALDPHSDRRQLQRSSSLNRPSSSHPMRVNFYHENDSNHVPLKSNLDYQMNSSYKLSRRESATSTPHHNNGIRYSDQKHVEWSTSHHRSPSPQQMRTNASHEKDNHLLPRGNQEYQHSPHRLSRHDSANVAIRRDGNRYPEHKQVQRSTSLHRPASPNREKRSSHYHHEPSPLKPSPSKYRETTRPVIPHPDYTVRSRSVDAYKKSNPQKRRDHESSHDHRNYRYSKDYSPSKEGKNKHSPHQSTKIYIPQPDYTWHRKKSSY